jgi:hypothetical protein
MSELIIKKNKGGAIMTYQLFISEIEQNVKKRGYIAEIRQVTKNNDIILDGLVIREENDNIAPVIYLNDFYKKFTDDAVTLEEITDKLISIYKKNKSEHIDAEKLIAFNSVKNNICYKLINTKSNQALLDTIPHRHFLDLSIVYYINMKEILGRNAEGTILINNQILKNWNKTEADLYELSSSNTKKNFPVEIKKFSSILENDLVDTSENPAYNCMYILSNKTGINGSAVILYPDILKEFADKVNSNLLLIPSSTHEWILYTDVVYIYESDIKEWTTMIKDVNNTILEKEEILSDHPYFYYRETRKIVSLS